MGFMFCDSHVSLKNPSSRDINLSNLPCLNKRATGILKTRQHKIEVFYAHILDKQQTIRIQ